MAEPASDFVTPTRWFSAPEPTPRLGLPSDTAPLPGNWMLWAMLPPPPPPSSLPPAAGSAPSSEAQPPKETQAPPGFDAQILPGVQPHFDIQSRLDSQPQINGQPSWNFQASTSWYWRQSPGRFPLHQKSHNPAGRLSLLSAPPFFFFPSSVFFFSPFSLSALGILPCTLGVRSFLSHGLSDKNVFLLCSFNLA